MELRRKKNMVDSASRATVVAMVESIVREQRGRTEGPPDPDALREVLDFVIMQQAGLPDYLRRPMVLLTLVFDWWTLPFTGRRFRRLSHPDRWRQIQNWSASAFGFRRDFIKFYETLALFAWFSARDL